MRILSFGGISVVMALAACGDDAGGGGGGGATDAGPACEYPTIPPPETDDPLAGILSLGDVMPPMRWNGVLDRFGAPSDLDLREFHCSPDWAAYHSLALVVSTGWCSACPDYIRNMNMNAEALEAMGTKVVYLEVETADFEPATSVDAAEFLNGLIMDGAGTRAGDADNTDANVVRNMVTQFPSGYFIRKRDMLILADQAQSIYTIDYPALAANPEGTWTPVSPPFESHCGESGEESGEPNDDLATARTITPDGVEVTGGICAEPASDFYRVDVEGPWRFDLYTDYVLRRYDLNLRLWNTSGERIGGSTQRSNHDWVDYAGPAYVEVHGQDDASDTYRVALSVRMP